MTDKPEPDPPIIRADGSTPCYNWMAAFDKTTGEMIKDVISADAEKGEVVRHDGLVNGGAWNIITEKRDVEIRWLDGAPAAAKEFYYANHA